MAAQGRLVFQRYVTNYLLCVACVEGWGATLGIADHIGEMGYPASVDYGHIPVCV